MTKDSEGQLPKLQLQELRNAESASDVVHLAYLLIQRRGIRKLKYFLHEFKETLQGPLIFCKARLLSRRRVWTLASKAVREAGRVRKGWGPAIPKTYLSQAADKTFHYVEVGLVDFYNFQKKIRD